MAIKIEEPEVVGANFDDWDKLIKRTAMQGLGSLCIGIPEIDTTAKPTIAAGSILHVNGVFYKVGTSNESVSGTPSSNAQNYIYACPSTDNSSVSFSFSSASNKLATWSALKGGWYNGNDRAIAKVFYLSSGTLYSNKVILDSYNAMYMVNTKQTIPEVETVSVYSRTASQGPVDTIIDLDPGMYRYRLRGGNAGPWGEGGTGGTGGSPGTGGNSGVKGANGPGGNVGAVSEEVAGTFIHHGGQLKIKVGRNGGKGGKGGNGGTGGNNSGSYANGGAGGNGGPGGGGGSGEDSFIGGIIAKGGQAGKGLAANFTERVPVAYNSYSFGASTSKISAAPSQSGGPGVGGKGGKGQMGEYSNASTSTSNLPGPGLFGGPGEDPPNTTAGYAYIYRVG